MKRTLTITFEFDDAPWIDKETGEKYHMDPIAYAMEYVYQSVVYVCVDTFVEATLDGEILVDRNGYISDEVKNRELQHQAFLRQVSSSITGGKDNGQT